MRKIVLIVSLSVLLAISIIINICLVGCVSASDNDRYDLVVDIGSANNDPYIDDLQFIVVHQTFGMSVGYFKNTGVMYIKSSSGDIELMVDSDGKPLIYDDSFK